MISRTATVSLAALWVLSTAPGLCMSPEESTIVKGISDTKLLKSDYRIAVSIVGNEAVVSAYINEASKNLDNDLKIEAVLIAKKAMSLISHLTRVKSRFYDLAQTSYREVTITAGDVAAFSSGSLTQDKLLASLDINVVSQRPKVSQSPLASPAKPPENQQPPVRPNQFKAGGIAFYYPRTWVVKQVPEEGEQGRLVSTAARGDASVAIHFESISPESAAFRDKQSWASMNESEMKAQLGWNQSINLGYGRNIKGSDLLVQFNKENQHILERHVYFKVAPASTTYHLRLRCDKTEFIPLNKEFGAMLATIVSTQ